MDFWWETRVFSWIVHQDQKAESWWAVGFLTHRLRVRNDTFFQAKCDSAPVWIVNSISPASASWDLRLASLPCMVVQVCHRSLHPCSRVLCSACCRPIHSHIVVVHWNLLWLLTPSSFLARVVNLSLLVATFEIPLRVISMSFCSAVLARADFTFTVASLHFALTSTDFPSLDGSSLGHAHLGSVIALLVYLSSLLQHASLLFAWPIVAGRGT